MQVLAWADAIAQRNLYARIFFNWHKALGNLRRHISCLQNYLILSRIFVKWRMSCQQKQRAFLANRHRDMSAVLFFLRRWRHVLIYQQRKQSQSDAFYELNLKVKIFVALKVSCRHSRQRQLHLNILFDRSWLPSYHRSMVQKFLSRWQFYLKQTRIRQHLEAEARRMAVPPITSARTARLYSLRNSFLRQEKERTQYRVLSRMRRFLSLRSKALHTAIVWNHGKLLRNTFWSWQRAHILCRLAGQQRSIMLVVKYWVLWRIRAAGMLSGRAHYHTHLQRMLFNELQLRHYMFAVRKNYADKVYTVHLLKQAWHCWHAVCIARAEQRKDHVAAHIDQQLETITIIKPQGTRSPMLEDDLFNALNFQSEQASMTSQESTEGYPSQLSFLNTSAFAVLYEDAISNDVHSEQQQSTSAKTNEYQDTHPPTSTDETIRTIDVSQTGQDKCLDVVKGPTFEEQDIKHERLAGSDNLESALIKEPAVIVGSNQDLVPRSDGENCVDDQLEEQKKIDYDGAVTLSSSIVSTACTSRPHASSSEVTGTSNNKIQADPSWNTDQMNAESPDVDHCKIAQQQLTFENRMKQLIATNSPPVASTAQVFDVPEKAGVNEKQPAQIQTDEEHHSYDVNALLLALEELAGGSSDIDDRDRPNLPSRRKNIYDDEQEAWAIGTGTSVGHASKQRAITSQQPRKKAADDASEVSASVMTHSISGKASNQVTDFYYGNIQYMEEQTSLTQRTEAINDNDNKAWPIPFTTHKDAGNQPTDYLVSIKDHSADNDTIIMKDSTNSESGTVPPDSKSNVNVQPVVCYPDTGEYNFGHDHQSSSITKMDPHYIRNNSSDKANIVLQTVATGSELALKAHVRYVTVPPSPPRRALRNKRSTHDIARQHMHVSDKAESWVRYEYHQPDHPALDLTSTGQPHLTEPHNPQNNENRVNSFQSIDSVGTKMISQVDPARKILQESFSRALTEIMGFVPTGDKRRHISSMPLIAEDVDDIATKQSTSKEQQQTFPGANHSYQNMKLPEQQRVAADRTDGNEISDNRQENFDEIQQRMHTHPVRRKRLSARRASLLLERYLWFRRRKVRNVLSSTLANLMFIYHQQCLQKTAKGDTFLLES